jgi:hypothetical protein
VNLSAESAVRSCASASPTNAPGRWGALGFLFWFSLGPQNWFIYQSSLQEYIYIYLCIYICIYIYLFNTHIYIYICTMNPNTIPYSLILTWTPSFTKNINILDSWSIQVWSEIQGGVSPLSTHMYSNVWRNKRIRSSKHQMGYNKFFHDFGTFNQFYIILPIFKLVLGESQ